MFYLELGFIFFAMAVFLVITQFIVQVPSDNSPLIPAFTIISICASILLFGFYNTKDRGRKG